MKTKVIKILTSKLTPWQRADSLKTFFYPSLLFLMWTDQLQKTQWTQIDEYIKPLLNRTLGLPPNEANEYVYSAREDGLFGIPLAADYSNIAHIDGGLKLLTSRNLIIKSRARG